MSTYFKTLLSLTAFAGLFTATTAMADFRDHADSKAWTNFGRWTSGAATSRSYRSNAPMIVRNEPAPAAVAQAPTTTRTYSYEPSKDAGSAQTDHAAPKATESNRSFSYEPATSGPAVGRGYSTGTRGFSIDVARHAKGY